MNNDAMPTSFLGYKEQLSKSFVELPPVRQLFFLAWITEYLFRQYGEELNGKFIDEENLDLGEVPAFLWYMVDKNPATVDDELLFSYINKLENDDIYESLDQNETNESGQANLISGTTEKASNSLTRVSVSLKTSFADR